MYVRGTNKHLRSWVMPFSDGMTLEDEFDWLPLDCECCLLYHLSHLFCDSEAG